MNFAIKVQSSLLLLAALLATSTYGRAMAAPADGIATTTVTAVGKKNAVPPEIKRDDVQVYQGKERVQVADWKRGEKLYLAVLIDDSLDSSIASQWNELKSFLSTQPDTTYAAVAYARNGEAVIAQDFTNDHGLASKALRIPFGGQGAFSSPYLSLQDLIKRWPASGDRRSIILISSGIDYFRGNFGPISPDLDSTIERAQKENINIWTIYAPDSGHVGRGFFRINNAQSNLSQLSDETGAESYYLGSGAPVTLKPYFDEISEHLRNQYLLSFAGTGGKKGRFERVRLAVELPNVQFLTPSEVFVPATK
jgi:VWFA-related protein